MYSIIKRTKSENQREKSLIKTKPNKDFEDRQQYPLQSNVINFMLKGQIYVILCAKEICIYI